MRALLMWKNNIISPKSIELDFTQWEQWASWMTQTWWTASYTLWTWFTFNSFWWMYWHRLKLPDKWTGSWTFKSIKIWWTLPNNKTALWIEEWMTWNVIRYAENGTTKVMTYYTNQPSAYYDVWWTFPSDVEMTINIDYATHTYTWTVNWVDYSIQPSYSLDFWKDAWLRWELVIHVSWWRAYAVIVISKVLITLE
jgi:hypothetical protein